MTEAGLIVLCPFISPYRAERIGAKSAADGEFIEVFADTPIENACGATPRGCMPRQGGNDQPLPVSTRPMRPETPEITAHADEGLTRYRSHHQTDRGHHKPKLEPIRRTNRHPRTWDRQPGQHLPESGGEVASDIQFVSAFCNYKLRAKIARDLSLTPDCDGRALLLLLLRFQKPSPR